MSSNSNQSLPLNFGSAIKILGLSLFSAVLIQNLYDWTSFGGSMIWLFYLGMLLLALISLYFLLRPLNEIIHTPYFAITSLLTVALATAFGTVVSQVHTPAEFAERYGSMSKFLSFMQMDDLFHSWWYVLLFVLMTISLVKISYYRRPGIKNLGFHLAHLGPVVILLGFWLDFYSGFRGLIQLQKGIETDHVWVYKPNTNKVKDSLKLDFNVRLDNFSMEKFSPDYRIQIWENDRIEREVRTPDGNVTKRMDAKALASIEPVVNKTSRIYNSDISFTIKEFYPNFYLEYSYPENTDTLDPKAPGILFELSNPHGQDLVHLQSYVMGRDRISDPILSVGFEFYWTFPEDIQTKLNNPGLDPEWYSKTRILFEGASNKIVELFKGNTTEREALAGNDFQIPGKSKSGYKVIQIYPDAAYLESKPSSRNDIQDNPVARLEVNRETWEEPKNAFLFPSDKGAGGHFNIPDSPFFLALESIKHKETKYWKSDVSLLSKAGETLKKRSIKVNEPIYHDGYRLYQTDYNPDNPNYSGIGISYTPGLYIIYAGFYILVAGVFMLFYFKSKNQKS
ncbi:MAG: hypothetical protein HKO89_04145 [Saprospiraceae bacterium]|nr:hypothetical protein [Saprospiraceae bacterium]